METQSSLFDFRELWWKTRQILRRRLTFSPARGHNKLNGTFGDLRKRDRKSKSVSADDIHGEPGSGSEFGPSDQAEDTRRLRLTAPPIENIF